jgi:hypothetical protein
VFVAQPTEAEGVRFIVLANGEVSEFFVHHRPVELTVWGLQRSRPGW